MISPANRAYFRLRQVLSELRHTLAALAHHDESGGSPDRAIELCQRLLVLDPLDIVPRDIRAEDFEGPQRRPFVRFMGNAVAFTRSRTETEPAAALGGQRPSRL